jgi:hypothetical protein
VLKLLLKLEGNNIYLLYVMIINALNKYKDKNKIQIILRLLAKA